MHGRILALTLGLAAISLGAPATAAAGPAEDFAAVFNDWKADREVTACRYSRAQLENTDFVARFVSELTYTDFPAQVAAELGRVKAGRCASRTPEGETRGEGGRAGDAPRLPDRPPTAGERAGSPIGQLRIARVARRGRIAREHVRITNLGSTTVNLAGATIRNSRGRRARVPGRLVVRPGGTVTVRLGCSRRRVPKLRGATAWACARGTEFFVDRGDVAQLVDRAGSVVSQRGFGRYRDTLNF
jgi:hypothetical protein